MSNGGMPAVPSGGEYAPVVRRWAGSTAAEVTGARAGAGLEVAAVAGAHSTWGQTGHPTGGPTLDFDLLVDRVVRALEQRVMDELERRGRRHLPGVF